MAATEAQQPARKDMPRRFARTLDDGMSVLNGNPDRSYVLVYRGDPREFGKYEQMSYEIERFREGGPRLAIHRADEGKKKSGKEIECMGHVLMSIDKAVLAEGRKYGGGRFGVGTAAWDELEARMKSKTGSVDPIEGTSRGIHVSALEEG